MGNFGSNNRLDYTIVGREVNTASRLESTATADQIQISDDTYELVKDEFECRPVGEIKVKGLAYPVHTYELIGPSGSQYHREQGDVLGSVKTELANLSPDEVDAARDVLTKALSSLDRRQDAQDD